MRRLPLRSRRLAPAPNNPTYDATTNTLTFHAGGPTSLSFVVTATNDNLVDSGETIVASLTGALITEGTATIATPTATSTITDIDAAVSFAVTVNAAGTSISEENTSDNAATFTVAMSGGTLAAGNSASVVLSLGGTATEGVDYSPALDAAVAAAITALGAGANNPTYDATTNTLTFHAGGPTSLSFVVTATNDNLVDSGETIVASLTGALITEGTATIATPTATSTITDIDAAVSFAVTVNAAGTSISEENTSDNAATFTVAMSGGTLAAGNSASVVLSLGGTATEGVDYSPALDAAVAAAITALGAGCQQSDL